MKWYSFPIFLLLAIGASSCGDLFNGIDEDVVIGDDLDPRFQQCYYQKDLAKNLSDSVVEAFFGKQEFAQFIRLNAQESFISCQDTSTLTRLPFGNENCCLPNTYDLVYDIRIEGKVTFQFTLISGQDMKFDFISPMIKNQLEGYKRLLAGEFNVAYSELLQLLKMRGIQPDECMIELVRDPRLPADQLESFYWEIDNGAEGKAWKLLVINAMTGSEGPEKDKDEYLD